MDRYSRAELIELVDAFDKEFTHLQKQFDALEKEKREDTSYWFGQCERRDQRIEELEGQCERRDRDIKELEERLRKQRSRSQRSRSRRRRRQSRTRS
eukprot:1958883-Amphidinium_carterae.1